MTVNNNRCLVINPVSGRRVFQKYVPQVQTSQNQECKHPQGQACLGSWIRQGLGSLAYDVLVHVPQVCWGLSGRGQVLGSSLCS